MALITSRYTMDKQDETVRRYLAERADLLGAIRLPNTAFKGNAGTEVTTDILFLRKRAPGAQALGEAWQKLESIDTPEGPICGQ
jgi:adenine-specific DNA methylase